MNVTWDHFWWGVLAACIVVVLVLELWGPGWEDDDADSTD